VMEFRSLFELATRGAGAPPGSGREPYPFQAAFACGASLPDVLAVPTGTGKTATAILGWLWRRRFAAPDIRVATPRRLAFCLPMRTLVEQTVQNAATWLGRLDLTKEVGVYALLGGAVDDRFEAHPEADAILIGTQDQLLSRALNRGYAMSRFRWPVHFALLNNDTLWVLDEVQLMGPGLSTSAQLQGLRRRLGVAAPTVSLWMSATMAEARLKTIDHRDRALIRLELGEADRLHPQLAPRLAAKKRLAASPLVFDPKNAHLARLASTLAERHAAGTLTLVVVNRVARAQAVFQALREVAPHTTAALIHSRFRPRERKRTQEASLAEGWTGILVATQAIEAGVDISARLLVTELAPWPSLVQRFGRCNRDGALVKDEAEVLWLDLPDDEAAPYEPADLAIARERLRGLTDVGSASLARFPADEGQVTPPVLRRRDLLDFFDTQADLSGHDVDVSPYVRATDDRDVQVAWRVVDGTPGNETPDLQRDELCSVPVYRLAELMKKTGAKGWRWSSLEGRWEELERPVPGMTVLLPDTSGGYSDELGFTGNPKDLPSSFTATGKPPGADESDRLTYRCAEFVTLQRHSEDVAEELGALAEALAGRTPWPVLEKAARWHDLGKAHAAFQEMLTAPLAADDARRDGTLWAKSDHARGRNPRSHFRHELASALALLAQGGSDLEAYLVAAHHGKVRLSIRSRPTEKRPPDGRRFALGVWDGDPLPAVDLGGGVRSGPVTLSLDLMDLGEGPAGPSWLSRVLGLVETHGPFRLAYWEALVRVADWRGTARRMAPQVAEDALGNDE